MLSGYDTTPVDELYINAVMDDTGVSRIGINNGIIVSELFSDPKLLKPKNTVRMLAMAANAPLILAVRGAYGVPIELSVPHNVSTKGAESIRDVVIGTRNTHRSLPHGHYSGFWTANDADFYNFGLVYQVLLDMIGVPAFKFSEGDSDLTIDTQYIDHCQDKHTMHDHFSSRYVVDFCALMIDPRIGLGRHGAFSYPAVLSMMCTSSIELACQTVRKMIDIHGHSPLPKAEQLKALMKKAGYPDISYMTMLFVRVIHGILTSPLDDLGVTLRGCATKTARDVEMVKQVIHRLSNTWLTRIYPMSWAEDKYASSLFDVPKEPDSEGD